MKTVFTIAALVALAIACPAQERLERQAKRQIEKLKCDTPSLRRYIEGGEVDVTQWDKAITIRPVNTIAKTYYFCECNRVSGRMYYEIKNDLEAGFIVVDPWGMTISMHTLQGDVTRKISFKTTTDNQTRRVITTPLKPSGGKQT